MYDTIRIEMAKAKMIYLCTSCTAQFPKWQGQCSDCGAWNTLMEETYAETIASHPRLSGYAATNDTAIYNLKDINVEEQQRISIGLTELDRVLGGGIVNG